MAIRLVRPGTAPAEGEGLATGDARQWAACNPRDKAPMKRADRSHLLDALPAMSHQTAFAMAC